MINKNNYIYILLISFVCFLSNIVSLNAQNETREYANSSVLATGNWYKIQIPATGVYKLTYKDLKKIGLSDPSKVHIYGYGGAVLDEDFSKTYVDDLPHVAMWMSSSPENFGTDDYILFYGQGNIKWTYDKNLEEFVQEQNPYSSNAYYFVTESSDPPLLMDIKSNLKVIQKTVTTFNDYFLHQEQLANVGKSGKDFYGEDFTVKKNRDFDINLAGITNTPATIHFDFISKAPLSSGILKLTLNNNLLKSYLTAVKQDYYIAATTLNDAIKTTLKEKNTLNLDYTRGSNSDYNVRLGYIRVNYERNLTSYGPVTLFRSVDLSRGLTYSISNATSNMLVFNVTGNYNSNLIETTLTGNTLTFTDNNTTLQEYALVDLSQSIPTPTLVGKIQNQDLHSTKSAKMVIIVQPELQQYAEELAALHKAESGLESLIINPEKIYNEFSSGNPDITAFRRFLKMLYDKTTVEADKPQYLLMFGGGTYDNRFINNSWTDENKAVMLLTYQSKSSLVETSSYVTDDYLGFLGDDGADLSQAELKLSVGRISVRTKDDAINVVDKIKKYMTSKNTGIWQNNITFVADDAVASDNPVEQEKMHMTRSEELAKYVANKYPEFIVNKIYEDAYERVANTNTTGATYPDATKALIQNIENGSLVLNYTGHGSTTSWSHENLLTSANIKALTNGLKLPFWITATCDFTRFDGDSDSGGELALFNKNGGAIGLISTVRVVYMANNKVMNENIIKHLFEKDSQGKPARMGDILRHAKNESNLVGDLNKLKFMLLGDPALRLYYPADTYKVEVTEVNGLPADDSSINIQGLSNVVIKGQIVNQSGEVVPDFDGSLESIVFDVEQTLKTKGNTASGTNDKVAQDYTAYPNKLFTGRSEIRKGKFEINFVAPKEILDIEGYGKMSFLAYDTARVREAQGVFSNYTVRGENPNAIPENNPPVISQMYLDKESFVSGDIITNSSPLFVTKVSDDTGINLSNNGEYNISILIDETQEYDLTSYFISDSGSNKSGTISFQLPVMVKGKHTIKLTVWDVWNNQATKTIDFTVANGDIQTIDSFEIWGNPAVNNTRFVFTTDNPSGDVNIKIQVYNLEGRMVWTHEERAGASGLSQYIYEWDLNGNAGGRLNPGIYICNAYITIDGKSITRKAKKLVILNY